MLVPPPSLERPLRLPLTKEELDDTNTYLSTLTPEEILSWALQYLPGLFQTTAFGPTGLVSIDMLSNLTPSPPPLIFIDTLYHFPETYELVEEVKKRYNVPIHVFKPKDCETVKEFEAIYGGKLWENDENSYDYVVKVRRKFFHFAKNNNWELINCRHLFRIERSNPLEGHTRPLGLNL
jgi:phosphoadenosine phosphosulfate reductase